MQHTEENLKSKTGAELCEILKQLGGTPPASGKFRTKKDGIKRILERQGFNAEFERLYSTEETFESGDAQIDSRLAEPVPQTPEDKLRVRQRRLRSKLATAKVDARKRQLRKKLRRIGSKLHKRRHAENVRLEREANGIKTRRAAEKARKAA